VFRIHSSHDSNLCLDLPSGNAVSGQDLQLYPCNSGNNQLWFVSPENSTSSVIKSILHLGLCVDVENATVNAPARIQLYTCHGGANQSWRFRTWLGTDTSVRGCNSTVRFGVGGPTVDPWSVNSFAVSGGAIETLCPDTLPFGRDVTDCPAATNWMVPDRRVGTGNYPVACFQQ
jgi:ricin-type beta-trefoil lectin protein